DSICSSRAFAVSVVNRLEVRHDFEPFYEHRGLRRGARSCLRGDLTRQCDAGPHREKTENYAEDDVGEYARHVADFEQAKVVVLKCREGGVRAHKPDCDSEPPVWMNV